MWLETMVKAVEDVPRISISTLENLRIQDRQSRDLILALNQEEAELLDSLKVAQKEHGTDFDEDVFTTKAKDLIRRRAEVVALIGEQSKHAQTLYDVIDKKIKQFDSKTGSFDHLLTFDPKDTLAKRKKKKRKAIEADTGLDEDVIVDPNEPVYCVCRMVSFGKMVGCENPECTVEWFHLACVGLTEDTTPEVWYCFTCREKL